MQYARHRLVINTIIISVVSLLVLVGLSWYLLYPAQNTSEFMYRLTRVIPVPVASVDGQQVRYSDYLMKYRSAEHYLVEKEQIDISTDDGKRRLEFIKREAMNDAIADAYAIKLAEEKGITVTDGDLETYLKAQREESDVTETVYNTVIEDYYGWSPEEYREAMRSKLLRQKVSYATDTTATKLSGDIEAQVKAGTTDLKLIADALNAQTANSVSFWPATWVPKDNRDGGLAETAAKLQKGQVSTAIKTTANDGYYYVKLVDSNDTQLQYEYLHIPLAQFDATLAKLKKDGKQSEYITIEEVSTQQQQQ
jgi:hypothetical protein